MLLLVNLRRPNELSRRQLAGVLVAVTLLVTACTSAAEPQATDQPATESTESSESSASPTSADPTTASDNDDDEASGGSGDDVGNPSVLPVRDGPARQTTGGVPHIQIDAVLDPDVGSELERRAFSLPGVESRESTVSLPGARSLWLADDIELARPAVILSGREFGHIHPDGSLHLLLPVERASEVAETKWGELHPWANRDGFWGGLVMVFTPESLDEVDISIQLIVDAYNFVTGADLDPADYT